MKTVYKAVFTTLDKRKSLMLASTCSFDQPWQVVYEPRLRQLPPLDGTYLYAFEDLEAAKAYMEEAAGLLKPQAAVQIWEAQADTLSVLPRAVRTDERFYDRFWAEQWYAMDHPQVVACPPGSVWCEWLTLTKKVLGRDPQLPQQQYNNRRW